MGNMGGVGFGWEAVWGEGNVLKSGPFLVYKAHRVLAIHSIWNNLITQRIVLTDSVV